MNILLTGATGFIGSYMLEGLLKVGHAVVVVKRSFSQVDRIEKHLEKCKVYDLDKIGVEKIYEENTIECVVHCSTYYGRDDRQCIKNIESNLLFPLQILSLGIEHGVKCFINTDSFFVNQIETDQDLDKKLYMCGYTLSKKQFCQWGRMFASNYGIDFINMKLEHVYGERDEGSKFIPYIVEQCKNNVPILELSEGIQERDFIHVSDVVNAYIIVINNIENERIYGYREYEVGTGCSLKLREFVEIIHKAVESNTLLKWGTIKMKNGEIIKSRANNIALKNIGWIPEIVGEEKIEHIFANWGGGIKLIK